MPKYINLTPRWSELLGTWQMIVGDAVKVKKPDQMTRFWQEAERAFKAADNGNDLIAFLRHSEGWTDAALQSTLKIGRGIQETERNTIHEESEA